MSEKKPDWLGLAAKLSEKASRGKVTNGEVARMFEQAFELGRRVEMKTGCEKCDLVRKLMLEEP